MHSFFVLRVVIVADYFTHLKLYGFAEIQTHVSIEELYPDVALLENLKRVYRGMELVKGRCSIPLLKGRYQTWLIYH